MSKDRLIREWEARETERWESQMTAPLLLVDVQRAEDAATGEALRRVFAAWPDGVIVGVSVGQYPPEYESAGSWTALAVWRPLLHGDGPTPTAALEALAERLEGMKP